MGYRVIDPGAVEPRRTEPCDTRDLREAAGFETLGFRLYRAEPGEQLPLAYHYHDEQEEAFYVLEGTLAVETPEGVMRVPAGQVFAATPGAPHRAHNPADAGEPVAVLAMGAPSVEDAHAYEPEATEE